MTGYITIGNLALELKTSNQKIGQIIKAKNIAVKRKNTGNNTHRYITLSAAKLIREAVKDFKVTQTKGGVGKKKKPEGEVVGENSDRLFRNPIISVDLKAGRTCGQGIWEYWKRERCETV
jgi:hypothetical protein